MTNFSLIPLPKGVASARYIDDMREVMAYRITDDDYLVRYDWVEESIKRSYACEPIYLGTGDFDIETELSKCLATVRQYRGIA